MKIGVLASQGAFAEHIAVLCKLGVATVPVRLPRELRGVDGLIIPGGESTSIGKLLLDDKLAGEIKDLANRGRAVFGTCAGMILMAKGNSITYPEPLGLMDIAIKRNAYGRQKESFETDIPIQVLGEKSFHAVFIRAPVIEHVGGSVAVLASLADGTPVVVRQGKLLASAFHPELTDDLRLHQYFLDIVTGNK